jgi:hypothetical protein
MVVQGNARLSGSAYQRRTRALLGELEELLR